MYFNTSLLPAKMEIYKTATVFTYSAYAAYLTRSTCYKWNTVCRLLVYFYQDKAVLA